MAYMQVSDVTLCYCAITSAQAHFTNAQILCLQGIVMEKLSALHTTKRVVKKLKEGVLMKGLSSLNPNIMSATQLEQEVTGLGLHKYAHKIVPSIVFKGKNVPVERKFLKDGTMEVMIKIMNSLLEKHEDDKFIPPKSLKASKEIAARFAQGNFYDYLQFGGLSMNLVAVVIFMFLSLLCRHREDAR